MMDSFETRLSMCRKCGLRDGCKTPVPGQGSGDRKKNMVEYKQDLRKLRVLLKGRGLVEEKEE